MLIGKIKQGKGIGILYTVISETFEKTEIEGRWLLSHIGKERIPSRGQALRWQRT